MGLQTRGSAELDKAQRRLAGLKSIDPNLDLGYGLTTTAYSQLIDTIQSELAKHNQKVAELDASRKTLDEYDRTLATLSGQILSAVKLKYGSNSKEYSQVGGSIRKKGTPANPPLESSDSPIAAAISTFDATSAGTATDVAQNRNGRSKKSTVAS